MTLRTVLLSIQALLNSPEPNDPQDAVVAKQHLSDPTLFKITAQFWAMHYAQAPGTKDAVMLAKLKQVIDMGVSSVSEAQSGSVAVVSGGRAVGSVVPGVGRGQGDRVYIQLNRQRTPVYDSAALIV